MNSRRGFVAFTWAKLGGYGHLDDALTLTCAVAAQHEARAERPLRAGLAIGIAIISKPWGVIFLPLTLATRKRDLRSPIVACALAAVVWLPFIVSAPNALQASARPSEPVSDAVLAPFGVIPHRLDTGLAALGRLVGLFHRRVAVVWCWAGRNPLSPRRSPYESPPTRQRGATTPPGW